MVGPFMQGVLLMGIIYWYSKGMLSLINDYYRSEIQRKIQTGEPLNESSDFLDVDQIVQHRLGKFKEKHQEQRQKFEPATAAPPQPSPPPAMQKVKDPGDDGIQLRQSEESEINLAICRREKRLEEFYRIIMEEALNICLLNELMLMAAK